MPTDVSTDELRELQREYLADVREKVALVRRHGKDLGARKRFKTSFPLLLFLSHQLKGSGASLGFPRISEVAQRMSNELNLFLDDEIVERPTPNQLSESILRMADELDLTVKSAEKDL